MKPLYRVFDDFCAHADAVRQSFLESGFGKWTPNQGRVGSSIYTGMNYTGKHALMLHALTVATGSIVFPNSVFARVSNTDTERAYIHSDRSMGSHTCIAYLSRHAEVSGTAFWRHKRTGLVEMPSFVDQENAGIAEELANDMVNWDEKWEQLDFVRGLYNRALVFHAPLFHSRFPFTGIGESDEAGRMIWASHYFTPETIKGEGLQMIPQVVH
jgi:Family of unknown function (DUF6445)